LGKFYQNYHAKITVQVKQNLIVKIICNKLGRKTRLLPLYKSLNLLKIENIYKLELAKFMTRFHAKNLPISFCKYFDKVTDVHHISLVLFNPTSTINPDACAPNLLNP